MPRYPLRLGSAKTVAYCHSQHRNIASLRRLVPDPVVEIAPADAAARGIAQGDWVQHHDRSAARSSRVPRSSPAWPPAAVFGQHGWWVEGAAGTPYDASHPLAANLNNASSPPRAPIPSAARFRCAARGAK